MKARFLEVGSAVGAVGSALGSSVAAICCIGPLALTLLGVNGMIFAAGLKPYRFSLLAASALMLGLAFWLMYRPLPVQGASCPTGSGRFTQIIVWLAAGIWMISFALQVVAGKVIL